jgi:hypothetical protein
MGGDDVFGIRKWPSDPEPWSSSEKADTLATYADALTRKCDAAYLSKTQLDEVANSPVSVLRLAPRLHHPSLSQLVLVRHRS